MENNPFSPSVPESFESVDPEAALYLREQADNLRKTHQLGQAGDSTFSADLLRELTLEPEFNLGSEGRFFHATFGILKAKYVRFGKMNQTLSLGAPLGIQPDPNAIWVATNQIEKSNPVLVLGMCNASRIPLEGEYGWVVFSGPNLIPVEVNESVKKFDKVTWTVNGEFGKGVGSPCAIALADGSSGLLSAGELLLDIGGRESIVDLTDILDRLDAITVPSITEIDDRIEHVYTTFQAELEKESDKVAGKVSMLERRILAVSDTEFLARIEDTLTLAARYKDQAIGAAADAGISVEAVNALTRTVQSLKDQTGVMVKSATESMNQAKVQNDQAGGYAHASLKSSEIAQAGATDAGNYAFAAQESALEAEASNQDAYAQAQLSEISRVEADAARSLAYQARDLASQYKGEAEGFKNQANTAAGLAGEAYTLADGARAAAVDARNLSSQYRNEAEGFKNTAQTNAGLSEGYRTEANNAKAEAIAARDLSAQYRDSTKDIFHLEWPPTLAPIHREAYLWSLGAPESFGGPYTVDWPQPYISNIRAGQGGQYNYQHFRKWKPRPETGRKIRVTTWFLNYGTNNEYINIWILTSASGIWTPDAAGFSVNGTPQYAVNGTGDGNPGTGWKKLTLVIEVSAAWHAMWTPILEVKTTGGAPNGTWHTTGFVVEDITGVEDAKAQAAIAEQSKVTAGEFKAQAEAARNLSAQYRDSAEGFKNTARGYRNEAEGFKNTAAGYRDEASGYRNQASGYAGAAEGFKTEAGNAKAAAEAARDLTATYKNQTLSAVSKLWPASLAPGDRDAYIVDSGMVFGGPDTGWPSPYITYCSPGVGNEYMHLYFKEFRGRPVLGRKIRVTGYVFNHGTNNHYFAIRVLSSNNPAWDGTSGWNNGIAVDGTLHEAPTNQGGFTRIVMEFTVTSDWKPFWTVVFQAHFNGAPSNGLWHMSPLLVEDITGESSMSARISNVETVNTNQHNAIAKVEKQVSAGNPNLVKNGGFEQGLAYWNFGPGWHIADNGWGRQAYTNNTGTAALSSDKFVVWPNNTYTIAADMAFFSNSGTAYVDMIFYDAGGNIVGDSPQVALGPSFDFNDEGVNRTRGAITVMSPSNATQACARFVSENASADSNGNRFSAVRQIKVEKGNIATPYSAEAQLTTTTAVAIDAYNRTRAYWQVNAAVPGSRAQLTVWADNGGAGVDIVGNVNIHGDLITSGTINGFKLANLAVDTAKIANEAVTKSYYAELASSITNLAGGGTITTVLTLTVTGVEAGEILRMSGVMHMACPDDLQGEIYVAYSVNGSSGTALTLNKYKFDSDGGASTQLSIPLFGRVVASTSGTYNFYLYFINRKSGTDIVSGTAFDVMRQRK